MNTLIAIKKSLREENYKGDYIDGQFIKPSSGVNGGEKKCISPADLDDVVLRWQEGPALTSELAVDCAKKSYGMWAGLRQEERNQYLVQLDRVYKQKMEEIAILIARETGKPLWESRQEAKALQDKIEVTLKESLPLVKNRVVSDRGALVKEQICYRSRGVFLIIGPFNFPLHLPNGQLLSALLCGNTVVFKPSENTPACGQKLAECFHLAGFPKGVFNMVQGGAETAQALVKNPSIKGVLFTGSYKVGLDIQKKVLNQPQKILALEMGGQNTSIVWKSADIDWAVWEVLNGAYLTAGQRCSSTSQVILHPSVKDKFIQQFLDLTKRIKVGHWREDPFMGSLINQSAINRYETLLKAVKNNSQANILLEGRRLSDLNGYFVSPSVVENFCLEEEVFTPFLSVHTTGEEEKIWDLVNRSGYGLCLSVFAKEEDTFVQNLFQNAEVGVFHLNMRTNGASSHLPFGGLGKSGNDRPAGLFTVLSCVDPIAYRTKKTKGEFSINEATNQKNWFLN